MLYTKIIPYLYSLDLAGYDEMVTIITAKYSVPILAKDIDAFIRLYELDLYQSATAKTK